MSRKIVLTGASGFVARAVIPKLRARGARLHLVGRNPDALAVLAGEAGEDVTVGSYDGLADAARGYDAILHMAVRNNDRSGDMETFRAANVALPERLVAIAREARIGTIVNMASLHALTPPRPGDFYAVTKAEGERVFDAAASGDLRIVHLRLPAVHGETFKGALSPVGKLPKSLRPLAMKVLTCLKPSVHVDRVERAIWAALETDGADIRSERIVSDGQEDNAVYGGLKRAMDTGAALAVILALGWLFPVLWGAAGMAAPGPGLVGETRIGRDGRSFTLRRFRTDGRYGGLLRRTGLHALPGVMPLLLGRMSLVGPVAARPEDAALIRERQARGLAAMKPGLTGPARLRGIGPDDPGAMLDAEAGYAALRTSLLDLKILAGTLAGHAARDGAAR